MSENELVPRERESCPFRDHFYWRVLEVGGYLELTEKITGRREDPPLIQAPEVLAPHDHVFSRVVFYPEICDHLQRPVEIHMVLRKHPPSDLFCQIMEQYLAQIEWIGRADGAANGFAQTHSALPATGYNLMDREPRVLVYVPVLIA